LIATMWVSPSGLPCPRDAYERRLGVTTQCRIGGNAGVARSSATPPGRAAAAPKGWPHKLSRAHF